MFPLVVMLSVLGVAPSFDVELVNGSKVTGELTALDETGVTISVAGQSRQVPLTELTRLQPHEALKAAKSRSNVRVVLVDGSELNATDVQIAKSLATLTLSGSNSVVLPAKAIHSLRFIDQASAESTIETAWRELAGQAPAGDLIVVRKKGALDSMEGLVGDVTAGELKFTLDGDEIDVKRTKVEGVVFAKVADQETDAIGVLTDVTDSHYQLAAVKLDGDALQLTTPAGLKLNLKLDALRDFDLSGGKIVYLSDLEPESFEFQPFFAPTDNLPTLVEFYRLRRDKNLANEPLQLDGRVYPKGLALYSRSIVSYRLPDKFRRLVATVGIDDAARASNGEVKLQLRSGDKSLWQGNVRAGEPVQNLDVDITGVRQLEIVVDYGDRQDIGDHLDLCDIKVIK